MEISMPKCKITVLKRSLNSDLIENLFFIKIKSVVIIIEK